MKRGAKQRPFTDYLLAGVLVVAIVWLSYMLFGIFEKEEVARKAAADAKRELETLSERETTLTQNLKDLETERGQEASIRETYGVALPGEEVIIVIEPPEEEPLEELSWWDKMLGFFGL